MTIFVRYGTLFHVQNVASSQIATNVIKSRRVKGMTNGTTLRSAFAYRGLEYGEECWNLFKEMTDAPENTVEYVDEILTAYQNGKINLDKEFNLRGYCYRVAENQEKKALQNAKKETFLFDNDEDDYEEASRQGGVSYNRFERLDDGFEQLENDDELAYAISTIKNLRKDFLMEEGIDLVVLLQRVKEFLPQAITKMREVCSEFELIGEQVHTILESGISIEEYFSLDF